jgi:hypothetical protein
VGGDFLSFGGRERDEESVEERFAGEDVGAERCFRGEDVEDAQVGEEERGD